jgi:hypothetical protein
VYFPEILEGKVGECFRAHYSSKRDLSNVSRSLMKDLQQCDYDKENLVVFVTLNLRMYMGSIGRYLTKHIHEIKIFFSFTVKMKTNFVKITGQGNLSSRVGNKIFIKNTSIVSRLQSRTLTERGLQIKVHKHFGRYIHLIWQTKTCELGTTRMTNKFNKMKKFCTELELGGLENLCSCVSERFFSITREGGES